MKLAAERAELDQLRSATEAVRQEQQQALRAWELKQEHELARQAERQAEIMQHQAAQIEELAAAAMTKGSIGMAAAVRGRSGAHHGIPQPPAPRPTGTGPAIWNPRGNALRRPQSARPSASATARQSRPKSASASSARHPGDGVPINDGGSFELRGWEQAGDWVRPTEFGRQEQKAAELELAVKAARQLEHDIKAQEAERRLEHRLAEAHMMRAEAKRRAANRPPPVPIPRQPPARARRRRRRRKTETVATGSEVPKRSDDGKNAMHPPPFAGRGAHATGRHATSRQAAVHSLPALPVPRQISMPWQRPASVMAAGPEALAVRGPRTGGGQAAAIAAKREQFMVKTRQRKRVMEVRLAIVPRVRT